MLTCHVSCHISMWVPLANVADDVAATLSMTWQVGPTLAMWRQMSNDSVPRSSSDNLAGLQVRGAVLGKDPKAMIEVLKGRVALHEWMKTEYMCCPRRVRKGSFGINGIKRVLRA
ncbi:hypothetical protein Tco_1228137 [Tanacetum coccineum]